MAGRRLRSERMAGRLPKSSIKIRRTMSIGIATILMAIAEPNTACPITCAKQRPMPYPNSPPKSPARKISVKTRMTTEISVAPRALRSPSSRLLYMIFALTRFDTPMVADKRERTVIRSIRSCVLPKIFPSDSAIWRTGRATELATTSSI